MTPNDHLFLTLIEDPRHEVRTVQNAHSFLHVVIGDRVVEVSRMTVSRCTKAKWAVLVEERQGPVNHYRLTEKGAEAKELASV